ncbi:MAG TPA: DUF4870 domain-containing protein [Candidatus Binatia bacterium]|nr:DUF4870 domain-containing protein [Candidatus Binatia bacterium]
MTPRAYLRARAKPLAFTAGTVAQMDCYYHSAVPSVADCTVCGRAICAHCRDQAGACPGCRLGAKIDAAGAQALRGERAAAKSSPAAVAPVSPESRALAALGYPFWPLALLGLLDARRSPYLRRHAWQALGFNFGLYAFWLLLNGIAAIPFFGWPAYPMLGLMFPFAFVASVIFGFRAWHGDDVRIPIVSDWVDKKLGN